MKERNRGNILGCDKFHHRERSIYHQPNHLKHKPIRIERKERNILERMGNETKTSLKL